MNRNRRSGRVSELMRELDAAIEKVKTAQRELESSGHATPAELIDAIGHMRQVRGLIETKELSPSLIRKIAACILYAARLLKELRSMLNCYLTRQFYYDCWEVNQTVADGRRFAAR